MKRHLWLDPGFGASGDMMLGALIGLGASIDRVRTDIEVLDIGGWSIEQTTTERAGISATRVLVDAPEQAGHHRSWSSIDALIAAAPLPALVADGARRTFLLLGKTEAAIHGVDLDDVHFHEVGAVDAIVDIVGSWSALSQLDLAEVHSGPVGLGHGSVDAAHGTLPVPAPATVSLLRGATVQPVEIAMETVTPTGAALLAAMVDNWGSIPPGQLTDNSRGAGGRNPQTHPNVLSAMIITATQPNVGPDPVAGAQPGVGDDETTRITTAVVLATNLDDVTPEVIGNTIDRLLEAGADDAWVVNIGMKKSRPGHELRVLADVAHAEVMRTILFEETGTLGLRSETVTKYALDRTFHRVEVQGHEIRIKVGPHGSKPEYEDLVAASRALGVPLRQLAQEARERDSHRSA